MGSCQMSTYFQLLSELETRRVKLGVSKWQRTRGPGRQIHPPEGTMLLAEESRKRPSSSLRNGQLRAEEGRRATPL